MAFDSQTLMDPINWQILAALQEDARLSMAQLARRVGLTAPAITQRVHRLEDAGIITGYRAMVDCRALGKRVLGFVRVGAGANLKEKVRQLIGHIPEVLECHCAGECFVLKVAADSNEHLESIAHRFVQFGALTVIVVMSSLLDNRVIGEFSPLSMAGDSSSISRLAAGNNGTK